MRLQSLTYFLTFLLQFGTNWAYLLDSDCVDGIGESLREGLKVVFNEVELLQQELKKLTNLNVEPNQANEEIKTLAGLLYKPEHQWSVFALPELILGAREELPSGLGLNNVPAKDVVFQCSSTQKQYKPVDIVKADGRRVRQYYNNRDGYFVPEDIWKSCFKEKRMPMFTIISTEFRSIVQVCPWFEKMISKHMLHLFGFKRPTASHETEAQLSSGGMAKADVVNPLPFALLQSLSDIYATRLFGRVLQGANVPRPLLSTNFQGCVDNKNPRDPTCFSFFVEWAYKIINYGEKPTDTGDVVEVPS